ncbi:MAG: 3-carboxy-cis,cis-muconate cycloisomerase [Candidatus Acidiferrales bacterium]
MESPGNLLAPLFTTRRMREIFSDRGTLQRMLDFEAALGDALVRARIAPRSVARAIESKCKADCFSSKTLANEAALAGNLAIPLVKALTALVSKTNKKAAGFVHWGATSQDAIDTGRVLQLRDALDDFDICLATLSNALANLAIARISMPLPGRTWLQQGPPVTVGLKAAGWLDAIERHRVRFREVRPRILALQFGGAVGTLAALDNRGLKVAAALARELKLSLPAIPWHSHRDRFAEAATTIGLLVGSLGKIARDISLLAQTEVGEAFEPSAPGMGGSSTMPHKRNPVGCAVVLAAAIRVPPLVSAMLSSMVQEHERGLGGWHAEWETLPEICVLGAGALARITEIIEGLELNQERMAENLDATRGLIMAEAVSFALAKQIGKSPAHELVEQACRRAVSAGRDLRDALLQDDAIRERLSEMDIARLLDPMNYLGSSIQMTKNVLSQLQKNKRRS